MEYKFKIIQTETIGVVKIKVDTQFNQILADKVIISENITARLFGKVNDVVLKKGATLFLHGILLGDIENQGGEIYIYAKRS